MNLNNTTMHINKKMCTCITIDRRNDVQDTNTKTVSLIVTIRRGGRIPNRDSSPSCYEKEFNLTKMVLKAVHVIQIFFWHISRVLEFDTIKFSWFCCC